jgi:hypothetical protein
MYFNKRNLFMVFTSALFLSVFLIVFKTNNDESLNEKNIQLKYNKIFFETPAFQPLIYNRTFKNSNKDEQFETRDFFRYACKNLKRVGGLPDFIKIVPHDLYRYDKVQDCN